MLHKESILKEIARPVLLALVLILAAVIIADELGRNGSQAIARTEVGSMTKANTWQELNSEFTKIVTESRPAVVTVSTDRVLSARTSPFAGDPFFDFFFGRGNRNSTPQEQYHQKGLGSGIIVGEDGTILTNYHVIDSADSIYVRTYDGRRYTAKVLGSDPKTDVAVIQISAHDLTAMPTGNSDSLAVGDMVLAIGSPMSENLAYTVTQGIVSATGRSNVGLADYEDFIQTDAAINPGNSGGPLVDLHGRLVGINTAIVSQSGGFQGIGFAVPVNMAMEVMNSLISNGRVVRGWLGVSIQDVDDAIASAMGLDKPVGALVGDVLKDSPAADAGLEPGDVIVAVDDRPVKTAADLRSIVASSPPGTKIDMRVERSKREIEVDVTLGEQPAELQAGTAEGTTSELLGFRVSNVSSDLAHRYGVDAGESGVFVTSIDQGSSAFQAGVREGDLIHAVNRKSVDNVGDFEDYTNGLKKGDYVLLRVQRSDEEFFIAFRL
jgi:serine protease Do